MTDNLADRIRAAAVTEVVPYGPLVPVSAVLLLLDGQPDRDAPLIDPTIARGIRLGDIRDRTAGELGLTGGRDG